MEPEPGQWGGVFSPGAADRFLQAFGPARGAPVVWTAWSRYSCFAKRRFLKSRGLEVCLALTGARSQPLRPETRSTDEPLWAHTQGRGPFSQASSCWMPGSRPTPGFCRSIPGLTSGLGVQGKLSRKGISELLGRSGWGSEMQASERHVTDVSYRRGTRGWGRGRGNAGSTPSCELG